MFKAAFDAAPTSFLIFDDDGRYVYANAVAARYMGAPIEKIVGSKVGDFTSDRNRPGIERLWAGLRNGGFVTGIHRIRALDGVERAIRYSARASILPERHMIVAQEVALGGQRLSPRESEVMQLLARGLNGTRIAEELSISRETVRTHIRNAMEKLQARTRPQGIAIAICRGEIDACEAPKS